MIAAELRGGNKPSLNEALGWIGSRVDDIYGAGVGRLEDVWIDPGTGVPRWLLVKEGRFGGRSTLIPFEDATAGAGHVWIPYERDVVRDAPEVEPGAPLTQAVESALRSHYAANATGAVPQGSREQTAATSGAAAHRAARYEPPAPPPQHRGPRPGSNHPIEAGSPAALGIPVPEARRQDPAPGEGSAFGQQRAQAAAGAARQQPHVPPAPRMRPPAPPPRPPAPAHQPPPDQRQWQPPTPPQATYPAPQRQAAAYPPPQQYQQPQQGHQQQPQYPQPQQPYPQQAPSYAYPPPQQQPAPQPVYPHAAPQQPQPVRPEQGPAQRPAPPLAPVPPAPAAQDEFDDPDRPVAIPVIHALDQPYRIEIQLEGDLRISGELKGFSMKPSNPPSQAPE